jgi:hypothetical protein
LQPQAFFVIIKQLQHARLVFDKGVAMQDEFRSNEEFTRVNHYEGATCSGCGRKDSKKHPVTIQVYRGRSDRIEEAESIGFFAPSCYKERKKARAPLAAGQTNK